MISCRVTVRCCTAIPSSVNGQITVESRDISAGGNDTLIGDAGFDLMMGGIGNDTFDLNMREDIAVGEFIRIRLMPQGAARDLVVSFLTPAVRDLDLLAQITLGLNFSGGRTEVRAVPAPAPVTLAPLRDVRLDLVLVDDSDALRELRDRLVDAGMDGELGADETVPGLSGFGAVGGENLLTGQIPTDELPVEDVDEGGETPPPPPADDAAAADGADGEGDQGTAPPLDEARAPATPLDTAPWAVAELDQAMNAAGAGGWKITGWRVQTDAA